MILPSLPTWMKQSHALAGGWINPVRFGCLMTVAALASEREVGKVTRASAASGRDVLN